MPVVADSLTVAKIVRKHFVAPASRRLSGGHLALRLAGGTPPDSRQDAGATFITVLLLLRSRFRCTWRGAERFARSKDASDSCPRRRDAGP